MFTNNNRKIMDILIIIFLLCILCGKYSGDTRILSYKRCLHYKGICALLVFFHHASQFVNEGLFFLLFRGMGYIPTTIFFFLSGYGLMCSYQKNPNKRILHKIVRLGFPYLVAHLIYFFVYGPEISLEKLQRPGETLVSFSWYIITLLLATVVFGMMKKRILPKMFLFCCVYTVVCMAAGLGIYWYDTVYALPFGMFWATYEKRAWTILQKNKRIILLFTIILLILNPVFFLFPMTWVVFRSMRALLCLILFLLFVTKFQIGNRITGFLGKFSYEFYLLHGISFFIFRDIGGVAYVVLSFGLTIFLSMGLHEAVSACSRIYSCFHILFEKTKQEEANNMKTVKIIFNDRFFEDGWAEPYLVTLHFSELYDSEIKSPNIISEEIQKCINDMVTDGFDCSESGIKQILEKYQENESRLESWGISSISGVCFGSEAYELC